MTLSLRLPSRSFAFTLILLAACGGKTSEAGGPGPGGSPGEGGTTSDSETGTTPGAADAGVTAGAPADAAAPPAAVTFVLKNSHTQELAFNMNRGWGNNFSVFTGKPPKAKSIQVFPTFCTAACTAPDEERCPVCEEPETAKEKIAAQKFEKVAPGAELEVPWDGNVLVYEKTKGLRNGKTKKCQCYRPQPVPPGTYTVKVIGLRLTTTVGTNSQLQPVETTMTLPSEEPLRVELDFGAPTPPPAPKKK